MTSIIFFFRQSIRFPSHVDSVYLGHKLGRILAAHKKSPTHRSAWKGHMEFHQKYFWSQDHPTSVFCQRVFFFFFFFLKNYSSLYSGSIWRPFECHTQTFKSRWRKTFYSQKNFREKVVVLSFLFMHKNFMLSSTSEQKQLALPTLQFNRDYFLLLLL